MTLKLTEEITDADDNQVVPNSITLNDLDSDDLPDDWEVAWGLNPRSGNTDLGEGKLGDFDGDGNSNFVEFINGTDPKDYTSFPGPLPRIVKSLPFYNLDAGVTPEVPDNTSFCVLIVDKGSGIDLNNTDNIRILVNDGDNIAYTVDLSNEKTVRTIKLNTNEPDSAVSALWVAYDRPKEDQLSMQRYPFEAQVHFSVEIRNNDDNLIREEFYYEIETQALHDERTSSERKVEAKTLGPEDPDVNDPEHAYDTGLQVISGLLEHTKLIFNSAHPAKPAIFIDFEGLENVERMSPTAYVQPPTLFAPPAKLIIPIPDIRQVDSVEIYIKEGDQWVPACSTNCQVGSNGYGWIVPGSRVNHNNGNPSRIEIKLHHSADFQAGIAEVSTAPALPKVAEERAEANCFIDSLILE